MKLLLDTDTCIELIRRRSPEILKRLQRLSPGDAGISSITFAELAFGAARSAQPEKNAAALDDFVSVFEIANFDDAAARQYGIVRATLEGDGNPIGALDTLIGSHALCLGIPLVTHNTREFSRIPGLRLADWIAG